MKSFAIPVLTTLAILGLAAVPAVAGVAPSHPDLAAAGAAAGDRIVSRRSDLFDRGVFAPNVRNLDTGETFTTIQEAVDDTDTLDGHTLQVEVATLGAGQTTIDKSVTLQGETGSEVVRMTEDTGSSGDDRAWFLVDPGVDLTVRDLTFDGNGFLVWQAFRHQGSGSFSDCAFIDIRFQPSTSYAGTAIAAFGDGPVDVTGCTFEQIGRQGVFYFGTGVSGSTAQGNTYTGKGDGDFLDYGIEVGAGAMVTILDNTITDNRGVASLDGSNSAGILVSTFFGPGTAATITSNDLLDNAFGIATGPLTSDTSVIDATCNRLVGNTDAGISNASATVTVDAENNWWGCNEGPTGPDCDDAGGLVDFDPWLVLTLDVTPNPVDAGGTATLTASLTENSDGMDTSALCTVPDGIPVAFDATLGSVSPEDTVTTDGTATATYQAPNEPGVDPVSVTVDNETVEDAVVVEGLVALVFTKTASPLVAEVGQTVRFELTVDNLGVSSATNVTVTDTLSADLVFVAASPECSLAADTVTCSVATLPGGDSVTFFIDVTASVPGAVTNVAQATADGQPTESGTAVVEITPPTEIPTLSEWGLALFSLLLALGGWAALTTRAS
jgi:uncharacterized repeat protein (TIGR01451 family)